MGIGTSMGAYYDDRFHQAAAQWDPKYDDNEISPDSVMESKSFRANPLNIYDDSGKIVGHGSPLYDQDTNDVINDMLKPLQPNQLAPE